MNGTESCPRCADDTTRVCRKSLSELFRQMASQVPIMVVLEAVTELPLKNLFYCVSLLWLSEDNMFKRNFTNTCWASNLKAERGWARGNNKSRGSKKRKKKRNILEKKKWQGKERIISKASESLNLLFPALIDMKQW